MGKIKGSHIAFLALLSYVFLMLGNGILSLTSPDEVFYVQTAREMAERHSWSTEYLFGQPQFEKPILTYWLLRAGFILFHGVTGFSSRFFPALFGIFGVVAVYCLGVWGFKDTRKALLAGLVLCSGVLYIGLSRTVFTDMIFSVLVALSFACLYRGYRSEKAAGRWRLLFFLFAGLAVLAKGFLGCLFPFLSAMIFLGMTRRMKFLFCKESIPGFLVFLLSWVPWYWLMAHRYGHEFTHEFYYNDHVRRVLEAEHGENDTWYFYPLNIIGCMFPWSLFVAAALAALPAALRKKRDEFTLFLSLWIGVVFVVCQAAHSKLASYIFPLFPAMALLVAGFIGDAAQEEKKKGLLSVLFVTSGSALLCLALAAVVATTFFFKEVSVYVSSKAVLYCAAAGYAVIGMAVVISALRRNWKAASLWLSSTVMAALCTVPFIVKDIEPFLSSKMACEFLTSNYQVNTTILASKPYVRDVRFYTGKDVAVIDIPGQQFFSPHPVLFLDSDKKVREFLLSQPVTYCILKPSSVEDMERLVGKEFDYRIVHKAGNRIVARVIPRRK